MSDSLTSLAYVAALALLAGAISLSGHQIQTSPKPIKSMSEPMLVPPHLIEHFAFGYSDLIADVFWLRSVQDFDFCGKHLQAQEFDKGLGRELTVCHEGWIFQMLDAVTRLAPRYRIAYTRGAIALSVIVSDKLGATKLFDRGRSVFPTDWYVQYCASYHYQFEVNDDLKAAEALQAAANNGGPNWVILLAAKLYNNTNKSEFGLQALEQFYGKDPFDQWPIRAQERWRELEAKLGRKVEPKIQPTMTE